MAEFTRLGQRLALTAAVCLLAYVGGCAIINRNPPDPRLETAGAAQQSRAGDTLSILLWNTGYAGLGRESDFIADGGRMIRPPGKQATEANAAAITAELAESRADVILLQEAARPGFLTRGIDVLGQIETALPDRWRAFSADISVRWLPSGWGTRQGLAAFSAIQPSNAELFMLPSDGSRIAGLIKRRYHAQALRFQAPSGADWTVFNLHLSAFDEGGRARREQIGAVMAIAAEEAAQGRRVVLGGDWNMRLAETDFPHATDPEHLFWVHDFPLELLPEGFSIVADPAVPSVRTNHQPYEPGVNYTAVIDGFIVGPGVTGQAEGIDLAFEHSDHNPVLGRFRAADETQ